MALLKITDNDQQPGNYPLVLGANVTVPFSISSETNGGFSLNTIFPETSPSAGGTAAPQYPTSVVYPSKQYNSDDFLVVCSYNDCQIKGIGGLSKFSETGANKPYYFTIAGQGPSYSTDTDNSVGTSSSFNKPISMATDGANTYVLTYGNKLRKIELTGTFPVSTLAGSGTFATTDGTGTGASFSIGTSTLQDTAGTYGDNFALPLNGIVPAMCYDAVTKNLYIAEIYSHTIRTVNTVTALVTTVAGSASVKANTDGIGTASRFYYPSGIDVDSTGNVWIGSTGETAGSLELGGTNPPRYSYYHSLRLMIGTTKEVITILTTPRAMSGSGGEGGYPKWDSAVVGTYTDMTNFRGAMFDSIIGLSIDKNEPMVTVTLSIKNPTTGVYSTRILYVPRVIYILEKFHKVRQITFYTSKNGSDYFYVSTIAGTGAFEWDNQTWSNAGYLHFAPGSYLDSPYARCGGFNYPYSICQVPKYKLLFIADHKNNQIRYLKKDPKPTISLGDRKIRDMTKTSPGSEISFNSLMSSDYLKYSRGMIKAVDTGNGPLEFIYPNPTMDYYTMTSQTPLVLLPGDTANKMILAIAGKPGFINFLNTKNFNDVGGTATGNHTSYGPYKSSYSLKNFQMRPNFTNSDKSGTPFWVSGLAIDYNPTTPAAANSYMCGQGAQHYWITGTTWTSSGVTEGPGIYVSCGPLNQVARSWIVGIDVTAYNATTGVSTTNIPYNSALMHIGRNTSGAGTAGKRIVVACNRYANTANIFVLNNSGTTAPTGYTFQKSIKFPGSANVASIGGVETDSLGAASGNVYISGTIMYGIAPNIANTSTFILSMKGDGSAINWTKKFYNSGNQWIKGFGPNALAWGYNYSNSTGGALYTCCFRTQYSNDSTNSIIYLSSYAIDGTRNWIRQISSPYTGTVGESFFFDANYCSYSLEKKGAFTDDQDPYPGTVYAGGLGEGGTHCNANVFTDYYGYVYVVASLIPAYDAGQDSTTYGGIDYGQNAATSTFIAKFDSSGTIQWQRLFIWNNEAYDAVYRSGGVLGTQHQTYMSFSTGCAMKVHETTAPLDDYFYLNGYVKTNVTRGMGLYGYNRTYSTDITASIVIKLPTDGDNYKGGANDCIGVINIVGSGSSKHSDFNAIYKYVQANFTVTDPSATVVDTTVTPTLATSTVANPVSITQQSTLSKTTWQVTQVPAYDLDKSTNDTYGYFKTSYFPRNAADDPYGTQTSPTVEGSIPNWAENY